MTNISKLKYEILRDELVIRYHKLKNMIIINKQLSQELDEYKKNRRLNNLKGSNDLQINPLIIEFFEVFLLVNDMVLDIAYLIQKDL